MAKAQSLMQCWDPGFYLPASVTRPTALSKFRVQMKIRASYSKKVIQVARRLQSSQRYSFLLYFNMDLKFCHVKLIVLQQLLLGRSVGNKIWFKILDLIFGFFMSKIFSPCSSHSLLSQLVS